MGQQNDMSDLNEVMEMLMDMADEYSDFDYSDYSDFDFSDDFSDDYSDYDYSDYDYSDYDYSDFDFSDPTNFSAEAFQRVPPRLLNVLRMFPPNSPMSINIRNLYGLPLGTPVPVHTSTHQFTR